MIETLIVIGGVTGAALIGLFVLSRDLRRWSNRVYALMTLSFIVLMVANLFTYQNVADADVVLLCIRLVAASTTAVIACLYFLLQFLAIESGGKHHSLGFRNFIFIFSVIVLCLDLTPLVFNGATLSDGDNAISVNISYAAVLFAVQAVFVLGLSVVHLFGGMSAKDRVQRARSNSILIGIAPTVLFAPVTSFILPVVYDQTGFVAFTPFYIMFFIVMVAYAMIRHGLFDIRLAAIRTGAYVLTLITLLAVYYGLLYLLSLFLSSKGQFNTLFTANPLNIIIALLIAFLFQPIKKLFDRLTGRLFYKDNYSIDEFIARLNQTLNSTNNLRLLLERTSSLIASTLKAEEVFFFIQLQDEHYLQAGTERHSRISAKEFNALSQELNHRTEVILASQSDKSGPVYRMMASYRLQLLMPLYKNGELTGYLCLGENKTSGYTSRDIKSLMTISDELTIAIQNALSVDEVRRLNDTLEQRISNATEQLRRSNAQLQKLDEAKDDFISMASHQLRTPLTSIKGYISMMMEGDVGKVSPEQIHVLNEAFISSERMVRLISDFLNVSRLQTGKFIIDKRPVDLATLVQRELDSLKPNAAARDMKFVYKIPKNIPELELDENKIQQVIMNFADNALYYSKEKAKITVSLKKVPGWVEFVVKDEGIGVPEAEQSHLFKKFFRATNARRARPDGTGVGLFLAKKVIDDHDGQIIFQSKEGKGSTFGFRLPIPSN